MIIFVILEVKVDLRMIKYFIIISTVVNLSSMLVVDMTLPVPAQLLALILMI